MLKQRLSWFLLGVLLLFIFNEFLIYYLALLRCTWPALNLTTTDFSILNGPHEPLKVMILADTHLLGPRQGHWFDKLRREWQMERAFQTSMTLHSPNAVFVLGDLLDEGKWCGNEEFEEHMLRFQRMFRHSPGTDLHVVVGNHDIGFHQGTSKTKLERFTQMTKAPAVRMLHIRDNTFVLLNSMALEGDRCDMCREAEEEINKIATSLQCATDKAAAHCADSEKFKYTRPILLQHFPMYRPSDSQCTGPDAPPEDIRYDVFREKWDCLSKKASQKLLKKLRPRLIVSGHTHHGCHVVHGDGIPEYTVPSFSWRNKNNPNFMLAVISNNNFALQKCHLPEESTVIWCYILGGVFLALWLVCPRSCIRYTSTRKYI